MSLLHDAIRNVIPPNCRPAPYQGSLRYKFNCQICVHNGQTADKRGRGAFFLDPDGSAGYSCFNCQANYRQAADASLTRNMRRALFHMGMSDDALNRLSHDLWSAKIAKQQGIAPRPYIQKQPLPAGAKSIGEWIADNIANADFNDVLIDLADMTEALRDSYYWTPDPGPSGDMNRRFIWVIGPPNDPMGWAANLIDDPDAEPLLSDPNIFSY